MKRSKKRAGMKNELAKYPYVGGFGSDHRRARKIERARRKEIAAQIVKEES